MKARTITVGRNVSKDYQSKKLEVTFELRDDESEDACIEAGFRYVDRVLAELDAPPTKVAAPRFRG